jgi:lysozyme
MKKRIVTLLSLIIALQFTVSAKKPHHKSNHATYSSRTHSGSNKGRKAHKVTDLRPVLTINDINDPEHLWGIDISHYQSDINWVELENEKPNFMFIKASEGADIQDTKYSSYYSEAKKIGIPVGSYHFFSYKSSGKEQAKNFLAVAQHSNGDLIPVLDAEYTRSIPADKEKVTAELSDFVDAVYEKLGYYPIIYCNYRYFSAYLTETIQKKCKLWIVEYKNQPNGDWTLWQKTDRFKLTAIKGHVDLNFFNGNQTGLQALLYKSKNG